MQLACGAISAGLPTLAAVISLLITGKQLSDFERRDEQCLNDRYQHFDQRFSNIDQRFDDTNHRIESSKETLRAEMFRIEQVLDARLKYIEEASRT